MSKDSSYDVNKVDLVRVKNISKKIVTLFFVFLITFHISSCSTNVTNESTVKNNINSLNKSYNNMVKQYGLVFKNNKSTNISGDFTYPFLKGMVSGKTIENSKEKKTLITTRLDGEKFLLSFFEENHGSVKQLYNNINILSLKSDMAVEGQTYQMAIFTKIYDGKLYIVTEELYKYNGNKMMDFKIFNNVNGYSEPIYSFDYTTFREYTILNYDFNINGEPSPYNYRVVDNVNEDVIGNINRSLEASVNHIKLDLKKYGLDGYIDEYGYPDWDKAYENIITSLLIKNTHFELYGNVKVD